MKTIVKLKRYLEQNVDKFACRWMWKRDPGLWQSVLDETAFLPTAALPKQRVWHILNEVWEIPRCPTTGQPVKWNENRYLTYSSLSAKSSAPEVRAKMKRTYEARTGHRGHWSSAPEVREKRRKAMLSKIADPSWKPTCGVKWTEERHEHYRRVWEEKRKRRESIEGEYGTWKRYYQRVVYLTRLTYRDHLDKIANGHLERGFKKAHLDHIFSVKAGWVENVPPHVIAHWSNLRMIPYSENSRKHTRCDKTLEQLYEDYNLAK